MLKELKETMGKKLKENRKITYEQTENINKERLKINWKEILELKSAITELKNSLEGLKTNLSRQKKKKISELEGSAVGIIQKKNKSEHSLRIFGTLLCRPTYAWWESQKKEWEKGVEIMAENFPNIMKCQAESKSSTLRYIIVELSKAKNKES